MEKPESGDMSIEAGGLGVTKAAERRYVNRKKAAWFSQAAERRYINRSSTFKRFQRRRAPAY
jgi:hypothetical protein